MWLLIFLVLFIFFTSSDFWFTASGILFVIAIISGIFSVFTKGSDDDKNWEGTRGITTVLSFFGAVVALIIGLLKLVF